MEGASGFDGPRPFRISNRREVIAMRARIDRALPWVFIALGMGVAVLAAIQILGLAE